jgi:ADP-ribose pyrophosphatase YjhB (NUDIX family)
MTRRLYPDSPVLGVGALILKEGKILLSKRLNEPAKGKWSIPGGMVELGETVKDAVMRETKEETNLSVVEPVLFDVVDSVDLDDKGKVRYHYVIIDFFVKVKDGIPKADTDVEELVWVPLGEVEAYDLTSSFKFFFEKNQKRLKKLNSYS